MNDQQRDGPAAGHWAVQAYRAARRFSETIDADAFIAALRARLRSVRRWRTFGLWALVALMASLSGILSTQVMSVAVRALHLTAIAVWFGGVATLLLMALMREVAPIAREAVRSALDPLTHGAFGVILGSGVILTAQRTAEGAPPEYLALVGVKVAVIAALLVLAPRICDPAFRRRAAGGLGGGRGSSALPPASASGFAGARDKRTRGGALAVVVAEFPLITSLALGVLAVLVSEMLRLGI